METKTMTETETKTETTTIPTPADVIAYIMWQLRLTPERVAAVRALGAMLSGYEDHAQRDFVGRLFAEAVRNIARIDDALYQLHRRSALLEMSVDDLDYGWDFEEPAPKPIAALHNIKKSLDDAYALTEVCTVLVKSDAPDDVMSEAVYDLNNLMSCLSERTIYGLTTRRNIEADWQYNDRTSAHNVCQSSGYVCQSAGYVHIEDAYLDELPLESYPAYIVEHAPTGLCFVVGVDGEIHGTPASERVAVTPSFYEHRIRDLNVDIKQDPDDIIVDVLNEVRGEYCDLDMSEWSLLRVEPGAEAVA